jgi:N,N'-diacetyllegionaminate synthase
MGKCIIIAEAGVNHNGSIELAKKLIDVAAEAGADYVKFQTFKADKIISKHADKAEYQKSSTNNNESHHSMIKKLELDYQMHIDLIDYSNTNGIKFLSTPFDNDSIDLLVEMDIEKLKIPSGEINNLPYLRYIGRMGKPIIMSSGMSTLEEIEMAINILLEAGTSKDQITVLHCNTEYPTPMSDVNLKAMHTIQNKLGVQVGYSDHTLGIEIPIAAVTMGAKVLEKHFTIDRSFTGPDHSASLEPKELKAMVKAIRNVEKAMGDGVKKPSQSEIKNIPIARKSIVANKPIKKGEKFSNSNLTVKRPGTGISPIFWDDILGKVANVNYKEDDLIKK